MVKITLNSKAPEDTVKIGEQLGRFAGSGDVFALFGHLGSGKTTLTKGICSGMGSHDTATSPSFTIMNVYQGRLPIYHFDFYRLGENTNWAELGLDEFLYGDGVSIIEWPEKLQDQLPASGFRIGLSGTRATSRKIEINSVGKEPLDLDAFLEALPAGLLDQVS